MRLSQISERRGAAEYVHLFHGCETYQDIIGILNNGLEPVTWGTGYDKEYDMAVNQRVQRYGHHEGAMNFLTRDLGKAVFYGNFIVEVAINAHDKELRPDEDVFPIGDIPEDPDDDWQWDEFRQSTPYLTDSDIQQLRQLHNLDQTGTEVRHLVRKLAKKMPFNRREIPTKGLEANVMTPRWIGLKGRNRIVGAYEFSDMPNRMCVCTSVIYNRGGTIQKGQIVKKLRDYAD